MNPPRTFPPDVVQLRLRDAKTQREAALVRQQAPRKRNPPRSTKDGPFFWASHAMKIRSRSAGRAHGLLVMMGLCARAPIDGSDFRASINNLADECALSPRAVQRVLPLLVRARVIEMESGKGKGEGGVNTANTFRLLRVNLSNTEGGGMASNSGDITPNSRDIRPTRRAKLAEDRELYAQRHRENYPPTPTATAGAIAAPASPGVAVKQRRKTDLSKSPAWQAYKERRAMARAHKRAAQDPTQPTPAPRTPGPAPVVSLEEAQNRAQSRQPATQPTTTPADARLFCKPGMAPPAPA